MSYISITSIMDFPVNWTTVSLLHRVFVGGPIDGQVSQVFELPWQQPEVIKVAKPSGLTVSLALTEDEPPMTGTYRAAECPITIKTKSGHRKMVGQAYVWAGWDAPALELPSLRAIAAEVEDKS